MEKWKSKLGSGLGAGPSFGQSLKASGLLKQTAVDKGQVSSKERQAEPSKQAGREEAGNTARR